MVAGAFTFGFLQHRKSAEALATGRDVSSTPRVETFQAKTLQSDQALVLPGVIRALEETKIYPHTSGYVKNWLVDMRPLPWVDRSTFITMPPTKFELEPPPSMVTPADGPSISIDAPGWVLLNSSVPLNWMV